MKKTSKKKEIPANTVVKGLITGFVSYGILIGFILLLLIVSVTWAIGNLPNANMKVLNISLPLLLSFCLYFIVHSICRISTVDLFKKCKTNPKNLAQVSQKMNVFFLICVIVSVIFSNCFLVLKLKNKEQAIVFASKQYNQVFTDNFTKDLTNDLFAQYREEKNAILVSAVIFELALVASCFSLIPYQKKMLLEYNEWNESKKED